MSISSKKTVEEIFSLADIKVGGDRSWDIKVSNEKFYNRILSEGSLGLGESYMDGWWEAKNLDQFFFKLLRADLDEKAPKTFGIILNVLQAKILNLQSKARSKKSVESHYDIGNDLYEKMLGPTMAYTCGYWEGANNLDEAQEAKFEMLCRKMRLKEGMKILDIGCGWGTLLKYAVEKYKVSAVGITLSEEQAGFAREVCKGLPVEIRIQDYRDTNEKFDAIVSVEMLEHVGHKNYRDYMKTVERCLTDDGIFALQVIGNNESTVSTDPWLHKYIFPNSHLPSIKQLGESMENLLVVEDWENIGLNYHKTLMAWHENFAKNWPSLKKDYDERFYRMWVYYLSICAGLFLSRKAQLWQITISKKGIV